MLLLDVVEYFQSPTPSEAEVQNSLAFFFHFSYVLNYPALLCTSSSALAHRLCRG